MNPEVHLEQLAHVDAMPTVPPGTRRVELALTRVPWARVRIDGVAFRPDRGEVFVLYGRAAWFRPREPQPPTDAVPVMLMKRPRRWKLRGSPPRIFVDVATMDPRAGGYL